jgi:hypothetical protein
MSPKTEERLPLAMRLAIEPRYSIEGVTREIIDSYDAKTQTSGSLVSMSGSWCTMGSTGNYITGRDEDMREDDA